MNPFDESISIMTEEKTKTYIPELDLFDKVPEGKTRKEYIKELIVERVSKDMWKKWKAYIDAQCCFEQIMRLIDEYAEEK